MASKEILVDYLEGVGITLNGSKSYDIRVHNDEFYGRLRFNPSLGAGEAYMDGLWDCDQLDDLFFKICRHQLDAKIYKKWTILGQYLLNTVFNLQSRVRSKKVAEMHYNLSNDLYERMLGKSMAYTCGYWKNATTLDKAQYDKFDLIARKLQLQPGERVLELGCGWGSFAKFIAENYGAKVVGVNISTEQVKYAKESCKGLPVEIHLCDYRDDQSYNPKGVLFDKVASIGLCEHVGYKNYHEFMEVARRNLKDDGLFLLHTIGRNDSACFTDPWITKYIFPNGMLPSVKQLSGSMENIFVLEDLHNIGADYDKTLMAWHKNFIDNWPELKDQYDEKFFRLWNYYLLTCAGAFRARSMQLWQMVLSPKGVMGGYQSVR